MYTWPLNLKIMCWYWVSNTLCRTRYLCRKCLDQQMGKVCAFTFIISSVRCFLRVMSSSENSVFSSCVFCRAMNVIQNSFPGADASLSSVHPLLVGSVNTIHYVQNWPGKGNAISCILHTLWLCTNASNYIYINYLLFIRCIDYKHLYNVLVFFIKMFIT